MGDNFSQDNEIKSKLRAFSSKHAFPIYENKNKKLLFPIYLLMDSIENDVIKDAADKIVQIISGL
jgi:hypothetical protein